jgi:hypothetical protein
VAEIEERLAERIAAEYRRSAGPDAAERARLLERVRSAPPPRRRGRALEWLLRPRYALSPLAGACAALALVALGGALVLALRGAPDPTKLGTPAPPPSAETTARASTPRPAAGMLAGATAPGAERVVQFVLVAPGAAHVELVGDFNGWDPQASPMRRAGDSWTLAVPVPRGRHVYAFVVDGSRWVSDPAAPLAPEDEFGFRKSVVVVDGADPT